MRNGIILSLLIMIVTGCGRRPYEVSVFESGKEGYAFYRIPAIVSAPDGTLLAFAEARKDGIRDAGDIDLVLKRSVDNGRTWGPVEMVWDDGGNTCGNPAPVFDEESGRLLLLMTWNLGSDTEQMINTCNSTDTRRVFITSSDDTGVTWTRPRELTSMVKDSSWTWFATGPCHAIQKRHEPHKGRIVVSCNYNDASDSGSAGLSHSYVIYSDDGGVNWNSGASAGTGGNESTVAELKDGNLLINMRNWERGGDIVLRRLALSADGGESWSETFFADSLYEPICQGAMLTWQCGDERDGTLLFSNPHSMMGRKNMTVSLSSDGGVSWSPVLCVNPGKSAYSDIVQLSDGGVGLLYEAGNEQLQYASIRFRYVHPEELEL